MLSRLARTAACDRPFHAPADGALTGVVPRARALVVALCVTALVGLPGCGEEDGDPKDAASVPMDSGGASLFDTGATATDGGAQDTGGAADTGPAQDTAVADAPIDVNFPVGDGACTPQCNTSAGLKVCGPDGCGSVCGFCPTGKVCAADGSKCEDFCKPDCSTKKCGDNGCGGSCGDCPKDYSCGVDFLCHEDSCVASCTLAGGGKKLCGSDGCGGSCGTCGAGDVCVDAQGVCEATACKGIPAGGKCEGDLLMECEGSGASGKKKVTDCSTQLPKGQKVCGYDTLAGANGCIDKPQCVPKCTLPDGSKKKCGPDGCGGVCEGKCTEGWACEQGECVAKVGAKCGPSFPAAGECKGTVWRFCSSGVIQAIDCKSANQTCGWNAGSKSYGCK